MTKTPLGQVHLAEIAFNCVYRNSELAGTQKGTVHQDWKDLI